MSEIRYWETELGCCKSCLTNSDNQTKCCESAAFIRSQLAAAKAEIERLRDEEKPFQRIHIDTLQSENKRLREALENISRIQQIGDLPQESRYYQAQWDNCSAIACAALGARKAWNQ